MFHKEHKSINKSKKSVDHKMSYDEHFTRISPSIDLVKSTKFVDIGDGTSKHHESDYDKITK